MQFGYCNELEVNFIHLHPTTLGLDQLM